MAPKKNVSVQSSAQFEIGSLYEQELQSLNEDLKRQAAMSMFQKMQPTNKMSVDGFLQLLKQHKDVWSTVASMGIVDFADAINDGRRLREQLRSRHVDVRPEGKRTRLNEGQKQALKSIVMRILGDTRDGMNRNQLAETITQDQIISVGVTRAELANKLRQPLGELVVEGKVHTIGEKRLMKYLPGTAAAVPATRNRKSS